MVTGFVATRRVPAPPTPPEVQIDVSTPPVPDPIDLASFAVSPDGQKLVFVGVADGQSKLLVRSLASVTPQPLPGTEGALAPFWSGDSRSVAFYVDTELKRIDLDGGLPRAIASGSFGTGGSWNRDGTILFTPNPGSPVLRVSADGGAPTPVTRKEPSHVGHAFLHFLPDGRHFLYFVTGAPDVRGVYIGRLDTQTTRKLFDSEAGAVFAAGHLLFIRQTTLFAHEFDAGRLELKGTPFRVAEGVLGNPPFYLTLSASAEGTLAMRIGAARKQNQLIWIDRSGAEVGAVGEPNMGMAAPSPSPDGARLVVNRQPTTRPLAPICGSWSSVAGWSIASRPTSAATCLRAGHGGAIALPMARTEKGASSCTTNGQRVLTRNACWCRQPAKK
jgi:WD40-like Beta Propeller Repeat